MRPALGIGVAALTLTGLVVLGQDGGGSPYESVIKEMIAALDGLTDVLPSAAIRDVVERYQGDPAQVARDLVEAANEAGGKDNITALFVAGSEFRPAIREARTRHATTRMRPTPASGPRRRFFAGRIAFLFYGILLGILLEAALHALKG